MEVLTETMGALAEKGQDGTFVIIEDADQPDQFVQFKLHDGVVYGEVGSRQWVEPYKPLAEDAVIALRRLGFTGGGPQQNYSVDGLPVDALALARLTEELFHTGYGRRTGLDLVVSTNNEALYARLEGHGAWVGRLMSDELDRVKPVDLDDVERLLRRRSCRVFKDQETGWLMTFWDWDDTLGTEVKVWFRVEAEGKVLRISGGPDRPIRGKRRWPQVIRACNDWNCDQRWPKAYLNAVKFGREDFGWVETSVDIPVTAGMHRRLVEEVVDEAVGATLRFFRFLNEKLDWSAAVATARPGGPAAGPVEPGRRSAARGAATRTVSD